MNLETPGPANGEVMEKTVEDYKEEHAYLSQEFENIKNTASPEEKSIMLKRIYDLAQKINSLDPQFRQSWLEEKGLVKKPENSTDDSPEPSPSNYL